MRRSTSATDSPSLTDRKDTMKLNCAPGSSVEVNQEYAAPDGLPMKTGVTLFVSRMYLVNVPKVWFTHTRYARSVPTFRITIVSFTSDPLETVALSSVKLTAIRGARTARSTGGGDAPVRGFPLASVYARVTESRTTAPSSMVERAWTSRPIVVRPGATREMFHRTSPGRRVNVPTVRAR